MKPGAVAFLVLVAAPALSAPNPFRLPSFFGGGGNQVNPFHPFQPQHYYPPPPPPPPHAGSRSPGEPAPSPTEPATTSAKEPWITLPFAPAMNVPFYVPTLFSPPKPTSVPPVPGTVAMPVNAPPSNMTNGTTSSSSLYLNRRGSNLGAGNVPGTPLPTPPPANRQA